MSNRDSSGLSKLEFRQRSTLRGVKKCPSCGQMNGNRAYHCRNVDCVQHKNVFDVVPLVSHCPGTSIYSLRVKEREAQPRSFVRIDDITLSLGQNAAVVSRKGICFIDSCRNTADCRHIKVCSELAPLTPKGHVYTVSREVLWNLNISLDQKQQLWLLYKSAEQEDQLPAVQRLNGTTFVVKCERSESFPAGRLHVTAVANGLSTSKGTYACACKKLKIIVEPDNSLVMQEEVCDHLLLVLAGILSSPQGKSIYANFTNSLQFCWMPSSLETPLGEVTQDDLCLGMSINVGNDAVGINDQGDVLIFDDESYAADLPDFNDVILNVDTMVETNEFNEISNSSFSAVRYASDAQLPSNCDIYAEPENVLVEEDTHLELSDCNIELMDQYQLTDQIDLCSYDIAVPIGTEPLNILTTPPIYTETTATVPSQLPAIELPTIEVIKKTPMKITEIVAEVKGRKQPNLPAKRALIVNSPSSLPIAADETVDGAVEPALAYSAWLDHVIEMLNDCIEPGPLSTELKTRFVQHKFHVHQEIFSHFNKSFSIGVKRRALDQVAVIETGKHKGLRKYVWHFGTPHIVKRIFSTSNLQLQLERAFELNADGEFVPYVRETPAPAQLKQRRPIYAKLELYLVNVMFNENNGGVLLSWTPDVLPRSNFGLLQVQFTTQTRPPH